MEVRRFDVYCNGGWDGCTTYEDDDPAGDYVIYDDYETLLVENERLNKLIQRHLADGDDDALMKAMED